MEFIENKIRRYTTFSKRKTGIMKKAYELSTLTGTQVMLLVASETGHVYTFATKKLQPMITSETGKNLIRACLSSSDDNPLILNNDNNNKNNNNNVNNNVDMGEDEHFYDEESQTSDNNALIEKYNKQFSEDSSDNTNNSIDKLLESNNRQSNDINTTNEINNTNSQTILNYGTNKKGYIDKVNQNQQSNYQNIQIKTTLQQPNYQNKTYNDTQLVYNEVMPINNTNSMVSQNSTLPNNNNNNSIFQKNNKNTLVAVPLVIKSKSNTTVNSLTLPQTTTGTINNTNNNNSNITDNSNQIIISHPLINQDNFIFNLANQQITTVCADQYKFTDSSLNNSHIVYPVNLSNLNNSNINTKN